MALKLTFDARKEIERIIEKFSLNEIDAISAQVNEIVERCHSVPAPVEAAIRSSLSNDIDIDIIPYAADQIDTQELLAQMYWDYTFSFV